MRHVDREGVLRAVFEMYQGAKEKSWGEVDELIEALGWGDPFDMPDDESVRQALEDVIL